MFVIIVGGGNTGSQLAVQLLSVGHQVGLIENRPVVRDRLIEELPVEGVYLGDGSSPEVLQSAGIRRAQVLVAVTGEDETNLVVTTLARFEFGVARTIARVNNPKNAWLFNAEMGVDVALNQADILAKLIAEEMSLGDMITLLKLRKGEYSIVEETVHPKAVVVGKSIGQIHMPPNCVFAAVMRAGQIIVPSGSTELQAVDEVIALVHSSQVARLAELLGNSG